MEYIVLKLKVEALFLRSFYPSFKSTALPLNIQEIEKQLQLFNDELKAEKYKLLIQKWNNPKWRSQNTSGDPYKKMDNDFDSKLSPFVNLLARIYAEYIAFVEAKKDEGLDDLNIKELHYEINKANYALLKQIFEQLGKKGTKTNKQKRKRAEDVTAKCVRKSPRLQATYRRSSARLAAKKKN